MAAAGGRRSIPRKDPSVTVPSGEDRVSPARRLMKLVFVVCDVVAATTLYIAAAMLAVAVAINFANVVGRYIFSRPIEWAEEVMVFLMVGAVFLAVATVTWQGKHIRIGMMVERLGGPARHFMHWLVAFVCIGVASTVVWAGRPVIAMLFAFGQKSEAAHIPMWIVHGSIQLGFVLMCVFFAVRIIGESVGIVATTSVHDEAREAAQQADEMARRIKHS